MIVPEKCPVCNDPMLNEYMPLYLVKSCKLKLNHKVEMTVNNANVVTTLTIGITNKLHATWRFDNNKVYVWEWGFAKDLITYLPFFEPDLSDYKKLVKKIKTYLVFS